MSDNLLLLKLEETLTKLCNISKVTVVTGDFNYDILKYDENSIISEFLNLMNSNFLRPCFLGPIRVVDNNRSNLINSIFINTIDKKIDSGNIIDKVSVHMPNFVLVKDITQTKNMKK